MASESRLGLNWSEVAAGAFAALTGAATAMVLGVYGTFVGAGIMSAVTTVVTAVSHHYTSRARAGMQRLRQGAGGEAQSARGSVRRPRGWREFLGGSALVAGSAVATIAALGFVVHSPSVRGLLDVGGAGETQPRPVIVKKIVKVESEDPATGTGAGGEAVARGGSAGGQEAGPAETPSGGSSGDGDGHSRSGTRDSESAEERTGPSSEPDSDTSSPAPSEPPGDSATEPPSEAGPDDDGGSRDDSTDGAGGGTEGQTAG